MQHRDAAVIDRRALLAAGLALPVGAAAQSFRTFGRAPGFRSGLRFLSQALPTTTWNPADKPANVTLSNGNLTATSPSSTDNTTRSVAGKTAGKWYYEVTYNTQGGFGVGVASPTTSTSVYPGSTSGGSMYAQTGVVFVDGNNVGTYDTFASGRTIGIAFDMSTKKVWYLGPYGWLNGSNPSTNAGGFTLSSLPSQLFAAADINSGAAATANFGATAFAYPVPSGFSPFTTGST